MSEIIEQGSPEWHQLRAGKFTGSRFAEVIAVNKKTGGKLKSYDDLIWELAAERLTGTQDAGIDAYALRWGREVEPYARQAYEAATGHFVDQVVFVTHPDHPFAGASPDGLVGDDGGLEMKSPKNSVIHLQRFDTGVPEEFIPQIQGCMWVTGRAWWDFVSYDARLPAEYQVYVQRIARDEAFIDQMEMDLIAFERLVSENENALRQYKEAA